MCSDCSYRPTQSRGYAFKLINYILISYRFFDLAVTNKNLKGDSIENKSLFHTDILLGVSSFTRRRRSETRRLTKWRWARHVGRMHDNRWTKICTEWQPRGGRRNRGGPARKWRYDIEVTAGKSWMRQTKDRGVATLIRGLCSAVD